MVLTDKEQDANEIRERCVYGVQHLFEDVVLVLVTNLRSAYKVAKPKGVECREVVGATCIFQPVLPVVEVFIIYHTSLTLHSKTD